MKRFSITLLAFALTCGSYLYSQAAASSAGPVPKDEQASREDVVALLEVLHSRRQMVAAIEMMKEQELKGARASFLEEHPHASAAMLNKLDSVFDSGFKVLNFDELVPLIIPIYQKYLSHEDVVSLISFYSSPTGQKYLERMPDLMKESGNAGGNYVIQHMDEVKRATAAAMQDFQKYMKAHPEELGESATKDSKE